VQAFTDAIGLDRYAIYVFDYGAPIGFRLALACPERVTAIISQNGNAYSSPAAQNDIRVIFALRHNLSRGREERGSRELRARRQELVNGLVKFLRLLRHRKVAGMIDLQVLRAGHGPVDLHFILRR
jgi:pimeloyl-ACP methyl ester carboxylesterase